MSDYRYRKNIIETFHKPLAILVPKSKHYAKTKVCYFKAEKLNSVISISLSVS